MPSVVTVHADVERSRHISGDTGIGTFRRELVPHAVIKGHASLAPTGGIIRCPDFVFDLQRIRCAGRGSRLGDDADRGDQGIGDVLFRCLRIEDEEQGIR